jgi:hypothetical protein
MLKMNFVNVDIYFPEKYYRNIDFQNEIYKKLPQQQ